MFLDTFANLSTAYTGQYDLPLVLLSLIVASLAIYISFRVAGHTHRVRKISPWVANFWWLGGALIMGSGFWALYFIGLLAFSLPVETGIDLPRALIYLVPSVMGSGLVLHFKAGSEMRPVRQWLTAGILGLGVGLMQYVGMLAFHVRAEMLFDAAWSALTMVAAVGFSWLALKVRWRYEANGVKKVLAMPALAVSSLALATASLVVHHASMLSIYFFPAPGKELPMSWMPRDMAVVSWQVAGAVILFSLLVYAAVRLGHRFALAVMVERGIDGALKSLNDSAEGIITTDSWGTIRSFNRAAEALFGCSAAQVVGENCLCLLPEKSRDSYLAKLSASGPGLSGLINRTHDLVFSKADGTRFHAELVITPLSRRTRLDFVGMIRDNSALRHIVTEKEKFQKKLEFLLEASPVTIYSRAATRGLPFTFVSANTRKLLGYEAGHILDSVSFWEELIHPEDIGIYSLDRQALRDTIEETVEYRLMSPDGNYRWISDTRCVILDEEGKPSQLIGSWRDVHEHKESQLQLALNEARLSISLKYANMATWDWIISSGEVTWSENMQQKLGLQDEQSATFKSFMEIVHPSDQAAVKAAFKQSLVHSVPFDLEYRVLWPDQSIHWLHSAGGLISDEAGNPTHMVGVLYEVTEQKRLHLAALKSSSASWEAMAS